MSERRTGKSGEFWAPFGDGLAYVNQALTVVASKTIQGVAYAKRFFATAARTAWNRAKTLTVRLQGVVGEVTIRPSATNDTVIVSVASLHKDNTGAQARTEHSVLLTRAAAGAQWHMIWLDHGSDAAGVTAGALNAGVATFSETFGVDSGPALIAVDKTLVGAVKLTPGAAGPVLASDIVYTLSDGTLLQERSDLPTFVRLPMEGGILLESALLECHTGPAPRKAYADFNDMYPLIGKVGHMEKVSLGGSSDTTIMEAMGDTAPEADFNGPPKSNGSASRFNVLDGVAFALAMQRRVGIIRVKPDGASNPNVYYEAAVLVKSWGTEIGVGSKIMENMSFDIDGNLELRGL